MNPEVWEGGKTMNPEVWGMNFALVMFALITVLIAVVVWQGFATWRARASAREEAYRKLAEQSTAAQRRTAEEQQTISEDLGDLRTQVAAIEKLLRDVG